MALPGPFSLDLLDRIIDRATGRNRLDTIELNPPVFLSLTDSAEHIVRRTDMSGAHIGVAGSVQATETHLRTFGAILPTALAFDARFAQLLSAYNPTSALYAADNPDLDSDFCPPDAEGFAVIVPPMIFGGPMKLYIENMRPLATSIIEEMVATLDPITDTNVTSDDVRYSLGFMVLHLAHAINTTYGDGLAGEIMKQMLFDNIFTMSTSSGVIGGRGITSVVASIKRVVSASQLRKDVFLLNLYQYCSVKMKDSSYTGNLSLHRDLAYSLGVSDSDLIQNWEQYTALLESVKTRTAAITPTSEWPELTPAEAYAREGRDIDEASMATDMQMLYFTKTFTGFQSTRSISSSIDLVHEHELAQSIIPIVPTQLPEIRATQFFQDLDPRDVYAAIPWLKRANEEVAGAVARMYNLTDFAEAAEADITFSRKQGITILLDKTDPEHPKVQDFVIDKRKVPTDDVYKEYWGAACSQVMTAIADQPFYADAYTAAHPGIRKKVLETDVHIPTLMNLFQIIIPRGTHIYLQFDEGTGPRGRIFVPKFADLYAGPEYAALNLDFDESIDAKVTPMVLGHVVLVKRGAHTTLLRPDQYQPRLGQFTAAYRDQLAKDNTVTSTDPAGTEGTKSDGNGADSGWDLWIIIALIVYVISAINDSEQGEMLALIILIARFMGILDKWSFKFP